MIEFSQGLFHSEPGAFVKEGPRVRLKEAGFRFHWGSAKCKDGCPGCAAGLPPLTWVSANFVTLVHVWDLLAPSAIEAFNRLHGQTQTSWAASAEADVPVPPGCEYKAYQRAAIAYAMRRKRVLFADEMGLGKTISALGWVNALGDEARTVVIVCPASLKLNWQRECEKWLVRPRQIEVVSSTKRVDARSEVIIANYERLVGPRQRNVFFDLVNAVWDVLIVDEAHRIKTLTAQRSVAILGRKTTRRTKGQKGLADAARRIAFLSGSPIPNRPKEFFPIAQLLAPDVFGDEWRFLTRYCEGQPSTFWKRVPGGAPEQKTVRTFDGAQNLDELRQLARSNFMIRRLKSEVWKEMPPKVRQIVPLQKTNEVGKLDEQFEQQLIELYDTFEAAALALLQPTGQLTLDKLAEQRKKLAMLKLPIAIEHIDLALEQEPKLIVFAHHHCVVEALRDKYKDLAAVVYGPTKEADRQKAVDAFQNDPSVRLFIGSAAAGEGLTLTAASHVIFVESSWVPTEVAQREDRAHRIGQTNPVLIQHLVWDGTVEARMIRRVVEKQEVISDALDGRGGPNARV